MSPRIFACVLVGLVLQGCVGENPPPDQDLDGDGFPAAEDCDDTDLSIHPDADEACDGVDNNCDGLVDEGSPDADGDGICDELDVEDCDGLDNNGDGVADEGFLDADGDGVADCVDAEVCDGVDNDGDGLIDEDLGDGDGDGLCDGLDHEECDGLDNDGDGVADEDYLDEDGDGVADCVDAEDCDGVDNDGDGDVDEGYRDQDGDGVADCIDSEDCDGLDNDGDGEVDEDWADTDGDGFADCRDVEECDGLDNNGDGVADEGFGDADGDGLADCVDAEDCDGLDNNGDGVVDEGYSDVDLDGTADCVDAETCDGVDNDGDGDIDEGYGDSDGDGVCDGIDEEECDGLDNDGDGDVDEDFGDGDDDGVGDCLDTEECDGLDNDGDGDTDEGYTDTDGDGEADCVETEECDGIDNDGDGDVDEGVSDDADGDGWSICDGDCDDADAGNYPEGAEFDDGDDNDCDDMIDEDYVVEGDILLTEALVDPVYVSDNRGEWFEVYNTSSRTIDLQGWTVEGGSAESFTVTKSVSVAPGAYAVFGREGTKSINGGVTLSFNYGSSMSFTNSGSDGVSLYTDTLIDEIEWDGGVAWPYTSGVAFQLDLWFYDAAENDDGASWCDAVTEITAGGDLGTPGSANGYCGSYDHDGDGWTGDDGDCNDADADIYPGAPETTPGVDEDCDGADGNSPPVAVPEANPLELSTCDTLELDGSESWDPDGDRILSYLWTLVAIPSGSVAEDSWIDAVTDSSPVFSPDAEGTFTFGLTVNDGTDDSLQSEVSVEVSARGVTNTAPVADAGADSSAADTVTCTTTGYTLACETCATVGFTLDGGGSSDADGDSLRYAWSTTSTAGTISDPTASSTTLVVSGVETTAGTTTTTTIEVELEVQDCDGEISTDTVELIYTCTGE